MNPRIITGLYKGQKLAVPASARPMTDRVKTSLFDILGEKIVDARVADLYAGSGNLGFESLSRGAEHVTFVEIDQNAIEIIQQNANKLKISQEKFLLIPDDAQQFSNFRDSSFEILFLDPPFDKSETFSLDGIGKLLDEHGIIILKYPEKEELQVPDSLQTIFKKNIGKNQLLFINKISNV